MQLHNVCAPKLGPYGAKIQDPTFFLTEWFIFLLWFNWLKMYTLFAGLGVVLQVKNNLVNF